MAIWLTWIHLFSFIKQSREATSRRRMRLPPTTPGKVKEDPPRNGRAETDLGRSNSLGEKTPPFKLQSSLQLSTSTNLMIKGGKSFETYEEPSV